MKLTFFVASVLVLTKSRSTATINEQANSNIQSIFDLLQDGDKEMKLEGHEDLVLLLGNTGAGKTTLTHFIAGDSNGLFSIEVNEGSGEYVIVDDGGKINRNSTIISKTLFPELVVDSESNLAYYDCPGFSDTRSAAHDISATYFIKRVLDSSKRLKFLIVVNYSSVRTGGDKKDFKLLLKHVTSIIMNVGKYRNSTALIVTKVENTYVDRGRKLVPDEKVIETIATFLEEVKYDIKSQYNFPNFPSDHNSLLSLIDVFLEKDGNVYKKIGLFRRPNESGPINEINLLQFGKKRLKDIVYKNTQFTTKDRNDFGYSISAESKNYVYDLGKIINVNIKSFVTSIGQEIQEYFQLELKVSQNIYDLSRKLTASVKTLSEIKKKTYTSLKEFIEDIEVYMNDLKMNSSKEIIKKLFNFHHQLEFLKTVSNQTHIEPLLWVEGFEGTIKFVNNGQRWNDFLISMDNSMKNVSVQNNITYHDITRTIGSMDAEHRFLVESLILNLLVCKTLCIETLAYVKQELELHKSFRSGSHPQSRISTIM